MPTFWGFFSPIGPGDAIGAPRLLKWCVDLASQAALIVASFDLKAVQLLRRAIAVADVNGKKAGQIIPNEKIAARRVLHPTPRIEPRRVFHPTPRIEPCDTIHIKSRVICDPPSLSPIEPQKPCNLCSPIQPPWKVMLWKTPVPPTPVIKIVIHRIDIKNKGSLIDMFI